MSENPFQSFQIQPGQTDGIANLNTNAPIEKLKDVAKRQRAVMFALLGNIGANIVLMICRDQEPPVSYIGWGLSLVVGIFAIYAIFRLAKLVSSTGVAVFCAILTFIPFISIIALFFINQKATTLLQKYKIKVGFLGANPDKIGVK